MTIELHKFQVIIRKNYDSLMIIFIKNTSFWCQEHIIENLIVSPYRANFWIGFCIIFKIRQNASKSTRTGGPVGSDPPSSHRLIEVGTRARMCPSTKITGIKHVILQKNEKRSRTSLSSCCSTCRPKPFLQAGGLPYALWWVVPYLDFLNV